MLNDPIYKDIIFKKLPLYRRLSNNEFGSIRIGDSIIDDADGDIRINQEVVVVQSDLLGLNTLTDPGVDRILFWDDSATSLNWMSAGSHLEISGTSINHLTAGAENSLLAATSGNYLSAISIDVFGHLRSVSQTALPTVNLAIAGTSGAGGTVNLSSQTLTVAQGTGILTSAASQTVTITHADTSALFGTYNSNDFISSITVDALGHLTAISTGSFPTSILAIAGTSGAGGTVNLSSQTLTIAQGTGILTSAASQTVTITHANVSSSIASGDYISSLTVNAQGHVTAATAGSFDDITDFDDTLDSVTGRDSVTANAITIGALTATIGSFSANITLDETGATNRYIEIGNGRTTNGSSFIDLIGDGTYTDYGLRLIRNAGVNADSHLDHRGTGALRLRAIDAGPIILETSNADRLTIGVTGDAAFAAALTVNGQLLVNSKIVAFADGGVSNVDHIRHDDNSVTLGGIAYGGSFHFVSDSTVSAVGNSAMYMGFITTTQNGTSAEWETAYDRSVTGFSFDGGTGIATITRQTDASLTIDISDVIDTLDSVVARNDTTTRAINTGLIHITGNDSRTGVFSGVPSPNQLLRIENTNTGVGTQAGIHLRASTHDVHLIADFDSTNNGNFRIVMDGNGVPITALRIYTAGEVELLNNLYVRNGASYSLFGSDNTGNTLTNLNQKFARIGTPHQINAEEPMTILTANSDGTNNTVTIGGGTTLMNAATIIDFRTSGNDTTTFGTSAMTIDGNQDIVITGDLTHITTTAPAINTSISRFSVIGDGTNAYGQLLVRTGVTNNTAGELWLGIRSGGGFIWSQKIDQDSNVTFSDDMQVGGQITMLGQTFTGSHASTLIFAHGSRIIQRPNGGGSTTGQLDLLSTGIGTYSGRFIIKRGSGYGGGAYNTTLDDLVLDMDGNGGISIMTPNSGIGYYGFGDPEDNYVGGMLYAHSQNQLSFNSNNAQVLIFTGFDAALSGKITTDLSATGVHHEFKRAGTLIGDIWISSNDFALRPAGGKVLAFGTSGTDADIKMFSTIGETFVMNGTTGGTTWNADITLTGAEKRIYIWNDNETATGIRIGDNQAPTNQFGEFGFDSGTQETYIAIDNGSSGITKALSVTNTGNVVIGKHAGGSEDGIILDSTADNLRAQVVYKKNGTFRWRAGLTSGTSGNYTYTVFNGTSNAVSYDYTTLKSTFGGDLRVIGNTIQFNSTSDYIQVVDGSEMQWWVGGNERMMLNSTGELYVKNNIIGYASSISDRKFKKNLSTIDSVDILKRTNGYKFDWVNNTSDYGFIAQEVLPEFVTEVKDGMERFGSRDYLTVRYEGYIPILVEGWKNHEFRLTELKSKEEEQDDKIQKLQEENKELRYELSKVQ